MKKVVLAAVAVMMFSCNKEESKPAAGFKTAYVDIGKISDEYEELKDLESKARVKTEEMGRGIQQKAQQWKLDYAEAANQAQSKGPQWAEIKMQELQKREQQITAEQQALGKQMQDEIMAQNDSVLKKIKKHVEEFGKKNGYDYIYSTSDVSSILYAKEGYNITDQVLKDLNDNYKAGKSSGTSIEEKKK